MGVNSDPLAGIQQSLRRLSDYCRNNEWAGFDHYDGLDSRVSASMPFVKPPNFDLMTQAFSLGRVFFKHN
jgi:hypothetical protein